MHPNKRCRRSLAHPNRTTPEYHNADNGVVVGRPQRFCVIAPIVFVGGMDGWWWGVPYCKWILSVLSLLAGGRGMCVVLCLFFFAYVLSYHSIFLHTHFGKSGKCRLEPTQTATTSSTLCRRHGPIWPKLEQHVVSSPTCRDISATFPAKSIDMAPPWWLCL